jgi:hypothetical protein
MADSTISNLPASTGVDPTNDVLPIVHTSTTQKVSPQDIVDAAFPQVPFTPTGSISATTVAGAINELDAEKDSITSVDTKLALKANTSALPTAMDSATAQAGTSTTPQTVSASVLTTAHTLPNQNTILGQGSFASSPVSTYNAGFGYQSLQNNTSGGFNAAFGAYSLKALTSGTNNTAFGKSAGITLTTGDRNTALGSSALNGPTTGSYNLGLGATALQSLTTGSGNISIGGHTAAGIYSPANDISSTTNNYISLGSTSATNAYIQVGWTTVSDARDKTNFNLIPYGLDFVTKLNPVSYQFKETRDSLEPHGKVRYGFKAQDILALEGENSVIIDSDDANKLRYNSDYLIPVLVNAIQELTAKVILLEAKLK